MVLKNTALLLVLLASTIGGNAQTDPRLQFTAPARYFEDALPLGNGRIGAMLYGDPARERILLNEATLWAGGPVAAILALLPLPWSWSRLWRAVDALQERLARLEPPGLRALPRPLARRWRSLRLALDLDRLPQR